VLTTFTANRHLMDAAVNDVLPMVAERQRQLSSVRAMRDLDPRRVRAEAYATDLKRDIAFRADRDGIDPEDLIAAAEERIRRDRRMGAAVRAGQADQEWAHAALAIMAVLSLATGLWAHFA